MSATHLHSPYTHPELIHALAAAERDVGEFFGALGADEFTLRPAAAWTPAEHLEHVSIVVSAVARGFAMAPWLLRLRFGRPRRASRSYEALRDDYLALLAQGAGATGRFVPGRAGSMDDDPIVSRTRLLSRWYQANEKLRTALEAWTERKLDRVQLPHPLLGRITAREMVLFTIYHNHHHIAAARRRIPRYASTAADERGVQGSETPGGGTDGERIS